MQSLYSIAPVWVQNLMVSSYGLYLKNMRYGGHHDSCFGRLLEAPWHSRQDLDDLEARMLQRMIRHSYENVFYYRRLFDEHGIHPSRIQDRNDLKNVPLLDKEEVRRDPTKFLAGNVNRSNLHEAYTSGSTGTPLKLYQSRELIQWMYACQTLVRKWVGLPPRPKRATFGGRLVVPRSQRKPPFWRWNRADNQMIFSSYHLSQENIGYYAQRLAEFQPLEIVGYPSAISLVAQFLVQNGIAGIRPGAVLTNSETLLDSQRQLIEEAFGCRVTDWYSSEEFVFFAAQCERADAYHVFPFVGILELMPSSNNPSGGVQEIVGTSLLNEAMPLIRYRLGDAGIPIAHGESCPCGRQTPLFRLPLGRTEDYLVAEDGSLVGRVDHVFKGLSHIIESQIVQETRGSVRVFLRVDSEFSNETANLIRSRLQMRLGRNTQVLIERVSHIERSERNKYRAVVSKLGLSLRSPAQ